MARAQSLSSPEALYAEEESHVVGALRRNGYPARFIRSHASPQQRSTPADPPLPLKAMVTLPYIRGVSEAVRRVLSPLRIRVVFCPWMTLHHRLVRPKDHIPVDERRGVVYRIPCTDCPRVYIGQTGRSLKLRLSEHRRALRNGDVTTSAVAEHVLCESHRVDLSQTEVIDSHPQTLTRVMLESWHIQQQQPSPLNREIGPCHTPTYLLALSSSYLYCCIYSLPFSPFIITCFPFLSRHFQLLTLSHLTCKCHCTEEGSRRLPKRLLIKFWLVTSTDLSI